MLALTVVLLLAGCGGPPTAAPDPAGDVTAWFVEVDGEGEYRLGPEELEAMDVAAREASAPILRLSWGPEVIPYLPQSGDGGWSIFFFAPDRSPRTSRRTAVRVDTEAQGEVMGTGGSHGEGSAGEPSSCGGGLVTARWEEDHRYLPQAEAATPWFWQPLRTPGSVTHTLTLTGAVSGPVTVTLHLWSHTAAPAEPDHRLVLGWDGRTVDEWTWDGRGMQRLTTALALPEGAGEEHRLTLETPALPGAEVAVAWLDGWEVSYRRPVTASGAVWRAESAGMRVEEAAPGARVLDVSDPLAPRDLGAVAARDCVATVPGRRYWVGVPEQARPPAVTRPARPLDVDALQEVQYLALAPAPFHDVLQPLLDHRAAQGLATAVVEPQAVYDALGAGQPEPDAVQALVRQLPALRYLLLGGDGTSEPGGSEGEPGELRVVIPFTRTTGLGETPADGLLGTDETGRPVVAVGRFPATTTDQLRAMVEKTIRWESEEAVPAPLLLSDDEAEFERMADDIAELLPPTVTPERLDAGDEGARQELLAALDQGPTWLSYTGHGSLALLCDEGLLKLEDGERWGAPALVTAWTCLAAYYAHPTQDSMAEAWLRAPRGGAVAFLGPVGETTSSAQIPFARAFYRALDEGEDRLGSAWLAALQEGSSEDVRWGYVLLGDPALRLGLDD
jgi:hypothetical protein